MTIACLRSERSDERELSVIDVERDNQPDQKSDVGTTSRAMTSRAPTLTKMKKLAALSPR